MLKTLQQTKIQLMKVKKLSDDKTSIEKQINTVNEILTEVKNKAVSKKTTVDELTTEDIVATIELVTKRRTKEIEAFANVDEQKAASAKAEKEFAESLIPEEFQKASEDVMTAFVEELKANGTPFKDIMAAARSEGNFDMAFVARIAK